MQNACRIRSFFCWWKKKKNFDKKDQLLNFDEKDSEFLKYLQSDICIEILAQNKMRIHIESGDIFFIIINGKESIYNHLLAKQDERKKLYKTYFDFGNDYTDYVTK